MIKNERQYRITKVKADEFQQALAATNPEPAATGVDPELRRLERAATAGQLETMREELAEYEALLSGAHRVLEAESFDDLPRVLIGARIAAGMSQKDLAEKLGLKEQQVQRYEATDYASASLATLGRVVDALGVKVRKDVLLPQADLSLKGLWHRLRESGLSKELVIHRLLPRRLGAEVEEAGPAGGDTLALKVASAVGRVFGISPAAFFGDRPLRLAGTAVVLARFKVSATAEATRLGAYTVYAHYLAMTALDAAPDRPARSMPETPAAFRRSVGDAYGDLTYRNVLRFAWDCGVVVLPLNDSGAFHGACWRFHGRHVIVLKQRNQTPARWLFDLLHELRHTLQEDQDPEFSVIEAEETSLERRESKFEKDADHFAANVMLDGRAKELAERCVERAGGTVERLKGVVPAVAREAGVDVGALANYMAFRLTRQGAADWWARPRTCNRLGTTRGSRRGTCSLNERTSAALTWPTAN